MNKSLEEIQNIYFIGIGGIGMSALARYFKFLGKNVAGYDKIPSQITKDLSALGIEIHFEDNVDNIPNIFLNKEETLVVYTPAVPKDHKELALLLGNGFNVKKMS